MNPNIPIPEWLMDAIFDKAREIAKAHKVSPFLVFNSARKVRVASAARGELYVWIRDTFQSGLDDKGHVAFGRTDSDFPYFVDWKPLSYPTIARIFGHDHSMIILAVQRRRLELKKQTTKAAVTETVQ